MQKLNITQRAIEAAGGPMAVARDFGKQSHQSARQWGINNKFPAHLVIDLCKMTKGAFQPRQIRPDIFDESHDVKAG
jgi:hypothetical protein